MVNCSIYEHQWQGRCGNCLTARTNRLSVTEDRSLCREGMSVVHVLRSVTMQRPISLHGDLEDDPFRQVIIVIYWDIINICILFLRVFHFPHGSTVPISLNSPIHLFLHIWITANIYLSLFTLCNNSSYLFSPSTSSKSIFQMPQFYYECVQ